MSRKLNPVPFDQYNAETKEKMNILEGQDIFADDFIRQEQMLVESEVPSDIQKFFEGTTIFITGATGFLGRILLEKLLRDCWSLKKIYVLMRPKKGKTVEQRFEEQFDGPVFSLLKSKHPNYRKKLSIVLGDMAQDGDVISEEDRKMLIQEVNVVFHCAATVRFDEKLRTAVNINVKATKFFLSMAHEMKHLKAFLYVSTAYSNCPDNYIKEQFYNPPYDYKRITGLVDILDDKVLDSITPQLIGKWPNTYVFTKIIGEQTVKDFGKGLPIGMVRPSIVVSTFKEPITGWIDNYYGPQGVVFGAGLGLLRTLHCNPNVIADLVPVDLVINSIIALTWDIGTTKGDNPNFERLSWREETTDNNANIETSESYDDIPIINYVSSERNPLTWGEFLNYNYNAGFEAYSLLQVWHSSLTLNKNFYINLATQYVCHYLPALIVDFILIIQGKKPMLLKAYEKIHKFSKVITYFCNSQWKFEDGNVDRLWAKMSAKDRRLFNFNIGELEWDQYFIWYLKGIRVYLGKDDLSTLPVAKKRARRLQIIHYIAVVILNSVLLYFLWRIFSPLFS